MSLKNQHLSLVCVTECDYHFMHCIKRFVINSLN